MFCSVLSGYCIGLSTGAISVDFLYTDVSRYSPSILKWDLKSLLLRLPMCVWRKCSVRDLFYEFPKWLSRVTLKVESEYVKFLLSWLELSLGSTQKSTEKATLLFVIYDIAKEKKILFANLASLYNTLLSCHSRMYHNKMKFLVCLFALYIGSGQGWIYPRAACPWSPPVQSFAY